jgi:hypothetical protein
VFGIGRLIVGTSGSPGSLQALRYAEAFARACDAALIPVIAWEPPGGDRSDRIQPSGDLRQACRDLAWQQLRDALLTVWGEIPGDPRVQPHRSCRAPSPTAGHSLQESGVSGQVRVDRRNPGQAQLIERAVPGSDGSGHAAVGEAGRLVVPIGQHRHGAQLPPGGRYAHR